MCSMLLHALCTLLLPLEGSRGEVYIQYPISLSQHLLEKYIIIVLPPKLTPFISLTLNYFPVALES